MALSNDLISQFAKLTKETKPAKTETTAYGTAKIQNEEGTDVVYVQIDGSDRWTPVNTVVDVKDEDRVIVSVKDHTVTITGNTSSPSASTDTVKKVESELGTKIDEFDIVVAHKVTTDELAAVNGNIEHLKGITAKYESMSAITAEIETLHAKFANLKYITADEVTALNAEFESLRSIFASFTEVSTEDLEAANAEINNLLAHTAKFTYVETELLKAYNADIQQLDADKLNANWANIDFANIDIAKIGELFAKSGVIKDLITETGKITGELVGVTIIGDLIKAGTLKADKLVVKGSDGLYYKLNIDGLNNISTTQESKFALLTEKPDNWETDYKDYYVIRDDKYVHVSDTEKTVSGNGSVYINDMANEEEELDITVEPLNKLPKEVAEYSGSVLDQGVTISGNSYGGFNIQIIDMPDTWMSKVVFLIPIYNFVAETDMYLSWFSDTLSEDCEVYINSSYIYNQNNKILIPKGTVVASISLGIPTYNYLGKTGSFDLKLMLSEDENRPYVEAITDLSSVTISKVVDGVEVQSVQANADGIVSGIKSTVPSANIYAIPAPVNITCTYKKGIPNWQADTYYKLDSSYESGLDGTVIVANSITADKIAVSDLVAFGATIGGFKIDNDAIRSIAKEGVHSNNPGIYMDNICQFAAGDGDNYIKYFYDESTNSYKLDISSVNKMKVGGRNLLLNSSFRENFDNWTPSDNLNSDVSVVSGNPVVITDGTIPDEPIKIQLESKNLFDNIWEKGFINISTGVNQNSDVYMRSVNYCSISGGVSYYCSSPNIIPKENGGLTTVTWFYYDNNKNYISRNVSYTNRAIIPPDNCSYVRFCLGVTSAELLDLSALIQIELGTTATAYTPHISDFSAASGLSRNLISIPYINATETINGMNFTVNNDGSITANGTATSNIVYKLYQSVSELWSGLIAGETYTASLTSVGSCTGTPSLTINYYKTGTVNVGAYDSFVGTPMGASRTKQCPEDIGGLYAYLYFPSGTVANNLTLYPQFELGSTATEYQPYLIPVSVNRYGKNLFPSTLGRQDSDVTFENGVLFTPRRDGNSIVCDTSLISVPSETWLYYKHTLLLGKDRIVIRCFNAKGENISNANKTEITCSSAWYLASYGGYVVDNPSNGFSLKVTSEVATIQFSYCGMNSPDGNKYGNIQLELGSTATEYEPYVEPQIANANADGTVEGLTMLMPTTTLMSNAGVIITATYNDQPFNGIVQTEKDGYTCHRIKCADGGETYRLTQELSEIVYPNTEYTLSGWIFTENASCLISWLNGIMSSYVGENDGWAYITATCVTPEDIEDLTNNGVEMNMYTHDDQSGNVYIRDFKMEIGSKATDWTPAPEDTNRVINEHVSRLTTNADGIVALVSSLEKTTGDKLDDINDTVAELRKSVNLMIDDNSVNMEIQKIKDDGITKVDTGMGTKFDINGMTVSKIDSEGNYVGETNTQITENGMTVNNNADGKAVLTANKDGVDAKDLHATTYLIIGKGNGRSRFEDYGDNRTGCFWIGG